MSLPSCAVTYHATSRPKEKERMHAFRRSLLILCLSSIASAQAADRAERTLVTYVKSHQESAIALLEALRAKGYGLSLDDFGTGYSSLSYLQQFPVDILKIDQSFVAAIEIGRADTSLAPAIVSLAANLRLRVVAEGVETEFQATTLRRLGCHLAQGFYFTRPVDPANMRMVLAERAVGASVS